MNNYIELNSEERKNLIKYLSEKEFKKLITKHSPSKAALSKAFSKTEVSRVDFSLFKKYVENHCELPADEIVDFYSMMVGSKIANKFSSHEKVKAVIDESTYNNLSEEKRNTLELYRNEYDESGIPINYDSYIKFLCMPDDAAIKEIQENKTAELIKLLEEEVSKKEEENSKLLSEKSDLAKQVKNLNNENAKLKNFAQSYEKMLSVDNVALKVGSLLNDDFHAQTYDEIYKGLTSKEEEAASGGNHDLVLKILAAKYAVIKTMKEGNK